MLPSLALRWQRLQCLDWVCFVARISWQVDPEDVPDYHQIITNPMDLATMKEKLYDGEYTWYAGHALSPRAWWAWLTWWCIPVGKR